ncbi:hypothetical protein BJ878DRAFT_526901 [Calycina marina]|uniref:Uncharacterized protein n=1 Tax=Calycina marina TaxID=1763456 RepID=A0A9P7YW32_9HELO|nr:hypothetical protein BJ878DRAFT_526901 [Calycina marina]
MMNHRSIEVPGYFKNSSSSNAATVGIVCCSQRIALVVIVVVFVGSLRLSDVSTDAYPHIEKMLTNYIPNVLSLPTGWGFASMWRVRAVSRP